MPGYQHYDALVLGQGLAGTSLAWKLLDAGLKILILDREESSTSSRVAAGLLTPITGKRFARMPDWDLFWNAALRFYRDIETRTNTDFFQECRMLRLLTDETQQASFQRKQSQLADLILSTTPDLNTDQLSAKFGGFEMSGGRLHVVPFLDASRAYFQALHAYQRCDVDVLKDVELCHDGVALKSARVSARTMFFCQGYQPVMPPEFRPVRFNPAKGEIIDVEIETFQEERVLHGGIWVAPQGGSRYRVGATYDWEDLSNATTAAARKQLTRQLTERLRGKFDVVQQFAEVRPTMHDFQPVVGLHPVHQQLGFLNGLGSKGSLMAPRLSQLLTEHLLQQQSIPAQISLSRWYA